MTVKQYLCQLKKLDVLIDQDYEELQHLQSRLYDITTHIKEIQVVTSLPVDPMADSVIRIMEQQKKLNAETDHFIDLRIKIVNQIHALSNPLHIQILYKRYVEYKAWDVIEGEMHYSYRNLLYIHKKAMKQFGQKYCI